jgi:gamma-carbonic anhydrase
MNNINSTVVLGDNVYIAPTAYVGGEVTIGDETTVMHQVVIRADVSAIRIGRRVNVQDGSVIHTRCGVPLDIEDEVAIGHRAVVHCRRVGEGTLIGTGAIVLDDCEIGRGCVIGAGAVLPPGRIIPDGKVVMGMPAKIVRDVTEADRVYMREVVERYVGLGRKHAAGQYPNAAG